MKNIHVLPTYKPSRLYINSNKNLVITKLDYEYPPCRNVNIYITSSDEKIKEGDYVYHTQMFNYIGFTGIAKVGKQRVNQEFEITSLDGQHTYYSCKEPKVVLTTDQDLINDGVQKIDNDFLEWLVKNPSCEWVEISLEETQYSSGIYEYVIYKKEIPKEESKKIFNLPIATNLGNAFTETMKSVSQHEGGIRQGEINLPSFKEEVCICTDECLGYLTKTCKRIEEPKQRLEKYSERFDNKENEVVDGIFDSENWGNRIVKQETLEEAAENYSKLIPFVDKITTNNSKLDFIAGAKWQQKECEKDLDAHLDVAKTLWLQVVKENKRMYSEEEVHNILNSYKSFISSGMKIPYFEWFEQFKKK